MKSRSLTPRFHVKILADLGGWSSASFWMGEEVHLHLCYNFSFAKIEG